MADCSGAMKPHSRIGAQFEGHRAEWATLGIQWGISNAGSQCSKRFPSAKIRPANSPDEPRRATR